MNHVSQSDLTKAARRVFSQDELQTLTEAQLLTFVGMVDGRMEQTGKPIPKAELEGFKELVVEYLYLGGSSK